MSRSDSKVWEDFMSGEYVQTQLKKIEKEAQAYSVNMDRNKLYGPAADPKNKTELSQSTETMGVAPGGASLVGSGDSKALYTTKPVATQGGEEQYADATVEGLEDVQKAMMDVAMKEPSGGPFGTQDNMPEKWDGIQAAGNSIKPFAKQGQAAIEDKSLEEILSELEKEEAPHSEAPKMMAPEMKKEEEFAFASSNKKKETVALLKELVKIANELDSQGQYEDAAEIDAVIKSEVQALASKKN